MKLVKPTIKFKESYCAYIKELGSEERYPYPLDLPYQDFDALIHTLDAYSKGLALPSWLVPNTTFWLVDNKEILGCSHLRHYLNEDLAHVGGHIGLGIRPKARGKGLSKFLLNATIEEAVKIGIQHVHIHCYDNNIPSKKMIESTGAQLGSSVMLESENKRVLRYIY